MPTEVPGSQRVLSRCQLLSLSLSGHSWLLALSTVLLPPAGELASALWSPCLVSHTGPRGISALPSLLCQTWRSRLTRHSASSPCLRAGLAGSHSFSNKPEERERKDTGRSEECGGWSLQSWFQSKWSHSLAALGSSEPLFTYL